MRKIKVIHICSSLDGGAGLCAARIMRATSHLGIDNRVLVKKGYSDTFVDVLEPKRSKNRALLLSSQQLNLNVIMVLYGLLTIRDGNLSSERLLIGNTEF